MNINRLISEFLCDSGVVLTTDATLAVGQFPVKLFYTTATVIRIKDTYRIRPRRVFFIEVRLNSSMNAVREAHITRNSRNLHVNRYVNQNHIMI